MKYTFLLAPTMALLGLVAPAWSQAEQPASSTLSLAGAMDRALLNSPRLAASRAALSASQGAELQARAWSNPEIGFEADNIAGTGAYRGAKSGEFTYTLSQKLEVGKRPSRRSVAAAERETSSIGMLAEKLDLTRDVKIAYSRVLAAESSLELANQQEKLAAEVLANVTKRVSAARDPLIYKSQAEVSLATSKLAQAQAERELNLARKNLTNLWGGEPLLQKLDASVLTLTEEPAALETYQAKLAENPDLTRYTSLKLAKQSAIQLEKAQAIPDPTVNVGLRTFRESSEQAMVVGVSMPIPVFDRNQGNVAKARAELNQVESEGAVATLNAGQALQEAWQEWDLAYREAQQLNEAIIPSAEKAFTLAREGYDRGRFAYLEILTAQRTLYEARGQYTQSLQRQAVAKAQVERLTAAAIPSHQGDTQ